MQRTNRVQKPRIDKMVIVYSRTPEQEEPKEGDRRMIKGVMHVRRQATVMNLGERCYLVSRGKPVFEWVTEEVYKRGYA